MEAHEMTAFDVHHVHFAKGWYEILMDVALDFPHVGR